MCNKETVISAYNLTYQIGKKYLLKYINWEVKKGEQWLVWGANGSGKTTLLSIIAGFREPVSGDIKINGLKFSNNNALALRKTIGFVSTSFYDLQYNKEEVIDIILSGLTGTLGREGCNITNKKTKQIKCLLKEFNLEDKTHIAYCELSKGQRQCVLLIRSLIMQPQILLLDEPLSGLDIINTAKVLNIIKILARNGVTVIFVTHDVFEINNMFDNVLLLKQGTVLAKGKIKEVFTSEKMTELYNYPVSVICDNNRFFLQPEKVKTLIFDENCKSNDFAI